MKSLFKRRPKVDIEIIKTESLQKSKGPEKPEKAEAIPQSDVLVNIVGKQQLREQFSDEELKAVAEQMTQQAQEIGQLALPEIVRVAQEARQTWRIDEAILTLWQYAQRFGTSPELEQELAHCLDALEDNTYFQRVTNGQLATILFNSAGFNIAGQVPIQDPHDELETRLTCACENDNLRQTLETLTGSPQRYHCYCLTEFERPLDISTLNTIWNNFDRRDRSVNSIVHFVVCKESNAEANLHITVHRVAHNNVITIPLERDEMRRAIPTDTAAGYLQSKVSGWLDNHRLFAATLPVTREGEFFGRESDIKQITNAVKGGQSFYVLGLRRMGKTSLIKHLESLGAFRSHLYAFLDLESYSEYPNFDRAVQDLLHQWKKGLQRKQPKFAQAIQSQIPGKASPHDQLIAFLDVLRLAADEDQFDIRCLVILDDVSFLVRQDGVDSLWKQGASQLVRLLRQRQEMVITGLTVWNSETQEIIEQEPGSKQGYTIYLGPLMREACERMVTYIGGIINMDFRTNPKTLESIYVETGGHPLWTRQLCDIISRNYHPRRESLVVTPAHIEQAAIELISSVEKSHIDQSLEALKGGAEKRVIGELAHSPEPVKVADLSPPPPEALLTRLKNYGLIEESATGSGFYRLRMRLLARYLHSQ